MRKHLPIIFLLVFTAVVFISISFQPSLVNDTDSIHAEAAKEMVLRHDWVTMHVNGIRYLEKAPLLYWLVATSYQIFGFNDFAVRFPTVVAIVLLGWMTYLFGRWAYSQKAGIYAAVIQVSCMGVFLFTRTMIPEALLTLLFTIAHFCFLRAFFGTGKEKRFYYGFYAAAALAVLSKGLIGIIFTVGPVFIFLLLTNNLSSWRQLRLLSGSALFLAIAAPWHLLAGFSNENFFWFYFVNEHFLRFIGQRYPKDYNKLPFLSYWLLHLLWLFPWSLGLPLLVTQLPSLRRKMEPKTQVNLYIWLWAGIILIFFSISTGLEYYTFPAYPALALLLGAAFVKAEKGVKGSKYLLWVNGLLAVIGVIIATGLGALVWNTRDVQPTGDLSSFINQLVSDDTRYTFLLGRVFDLTPKAVAELRGPAIAGALVLGLGFPLAFWFRKRRQHMQAMMAMLLTMGLIFICSNRAQVHFEPVLSSRFLANEITQRWEPGAKIVINGAYESGSTLGFYTNQQILLLNGRYLVLEYGSRYPDAPPVFLNYEDVRRLWRGPNRIFLYTENLKKEELLKNLDMPVIFVAEKGGRSLFMNKP